MKALRADQCTDGRVDWHSFIAEAEGPPMAAIPPAPFKSLRNALPVPVRWPGQPADRYWAFENARVDFAGVESSPTSLARMVLTGFAPASGNDLVFAAARGAAGARRDGQSGPG